MKQISRDSEELERLLGEQLGFLKRSSDSYDLGYFDECKRIALTIRVLVHDTKASTSLLTLLGTKNTLKFWDLSLPHEPTNLISHSGLVRQAIGGVSGSKGAAILPMFDTEPPKLVSFEDWWNGVVFVLPDKTTFTRQDLILTAANQEGGAHVDPVLDSDYAALTRGNSLGWFDEVDGLQTPAKDFVPASIRHMAFEVLKTISPERAVRPPDPKGFGVITYGASVVEGNRRPPTPARNPIKPGRNSPCPCGSGKKYKKCCIP